MKIDFENNKPKIVIINSKYNIKKNEFLILLNGSVVKNINYLHKTILQHKNYTHIVQGYIKKIDIPILTILNVKKIIITKENNKNEFNV